MNWILAAVTRANQAHFSFKKQTNHTCLKCWMWKKKQHEIQQGFGSRSSEVQSDALANWATGAGQWEGLGMRLMVINILSEYWFKFFQLVVEGPISAESTTLSNLLIKCLKINYLVVWQATSGLSGATKFVSQLYKLEGFLKTANMPVQAVQVNCTHIRRLQCSKCEFHEMLGKTRAFEAVKLVN